MNQTTQIRLTTLAVPAACVLLRLSPIPLPCPIHQYTGLLCPGCGATRALTALTHAHLTDAFRLNPLLVAAALPAALLYLALAHRTSAWPRIPPALTAVALALTTLFTLARNLP